MRALITRITKVASLGLTALALASCGGGDGGDGGYTSRPLIDVKITATPSTLPANTLGVGIQIGNSYTNLITVAVTQDDRPYPAASVSIDLIGPNGAGALYYLDGDPEHETCETNSSGVEVCTPNAYRRLVFEETSGYVTGHFGAWSEPGTVTVVASTSDPSTGQSVSATTTITVGSTANTGVPGAVSFLNTTQGALYIQGQNNTDTATMELAVTDDGGFKLSAPTGVNNLQVELLDGRPNGGEYLATKGASGNQTGTLVKTYTSSSLAQVVLHSGSLPGTVRIKATADRSDNNVDNGIQSPISTVETVVISSGQVTSLNFTGTYAGAVTNYANSLPSGMGDSVNVTTGVYTRTLSIVAADEFGNPPPANTPITLRLVDSPAVGYPDSGRGTFVITGSDGNPQEGGSVFTTKTTIPTTTGCPATNSILVLEGLRPYQSGSRIVTGFNPPMTLSVNNAFYDWQVDTGYSVPYVVGCTPHYGNVDSVAYTDSNGAASFAMRYPVTMLGHNFILTAEAAGSKVGAVMRHWYLGIMENASLNLLTGDGGDTETVTLGSPVCDEDSVTGTSCVYSGSDSERFQLMDGNNQPLAAELLAVEVRPNPTTLTTVQTSITSLESTLREIQNTAAGTNDNPDTSQNAAFIQCTIDLTATATTAQTGTCATLQNRAILIVARLQNLMLLLEALTSPNDHVTVTPNPVRTTSGGLAEVTITATDVPGGVQYDLVFATVGATTDESNNPLLTNTVVITVAAPGSIDNGSGG